VYVELDPAATEALRAQWAEWGQGVELVVLESPYRSLMEPLLDYIEELQRRPRRYVTVILPEFVPRGCGSTCCTTSTRCSSRARCSSSRMSS
jgi:hypothetical protein